MRVVPRGRRSATSRNLQGLEISIPAKRNIFLLLFLTAWLVGWGFGGLFAARELLFGQENEADLFLLVWLVMWTVAGGFALYTWLWMMNGREVLVLRSDALIVRREVIGMARTREYDRQHTKNLRVAPSTWMPFDLSSGLQMWGIGGGLIAFDYGSQTIRLASGVDEAEAQEIVRELKAEHP
jgi:hypothetical protein